ncbi:hypothetical protein AAEO56_01155 [Flavobacterium sp. DGU11]|uniref:DUF6892 domain-containing protein n=1 Tax=Flavobacterium arundinis TaxID=3139143 RepID=A0ABU9HRR5_9FLAO
MNTTAFKDFINKLSERSDIEIHSIDLGQPASAAVLDDYKGEIPTELLEFYAVMNGCHLYASFKHDRNLEVGINIPAIEYLHAFRPADQTNLNIDEKFLSLEFEWIENNYSPFYYVMALGETDVNQSAIMRLELFPERHMVKAADSLENWMEKAADAGLTVGWASPDFHDNVTAIKKLLSTPPNNNDTKEPIGENNRKTVNRQFRDVNFKISIIGALHELGYYVEEAERIQNENADWDQSHKPIPAVLEFYTNLEIDQNYLDEIEGLYPDGGDLCYQYLFNEWDGEDNQFDIKSLEGIELLTNLKIFEPISMITDDGLDYAPLLLCKNLEKAAPEFIDDDEDGILQQLKDRGVETGDRHSKHNNEVSVSEPVPFDTETKRILVFSLNEFEERFGKLEMDISKTVYESPFYIYDLSLESQGPKFPDEKDISDEDFRTGFEILNKIWLDHIVHSSAMYYTPIFKKEPNPENNKHSISCSYGFAPGYDVNAAIENIARYDFVVVRWEDFWKI